MSAVAIQLTIGLLAEVVKAYPQVRADIAALLAKENPTPEDWLVLRAKIAGTSFESLAPDAPT